jgi:hypothetical protein
MGTRSKGLGFGVVAVTLGLAACGGKYDVGSGEDAGPGDAGAGNAGDDGSGGSSTSGRSSGGTAGGTSGGRSGETGGASAGGASAGGFAGASIGGSSAGGSSGMVSCSVDEGSFPVTERATPEVVWDRLAMFIHGVPREPLLPLPETTTNDWVREAVRVLADQAVLDVFDGLGGLERFMRDWAFGGEGADSARFWMDGFTAVDSTTGIPVTFGNIFKTVLYDGEIRTSFMSDRAFLVVHPNSTRRAIWMMANLACVEMPLPPPEIVIDPVSVPPNMTRRQTIEAAVSDAVCIGCHAVFDPFGFSLENYDELGDFRTTENGLPIDASGTVDVNGIYSTFDDIGDLGPELGASCTVMQCFASKLFEYALAGAHPDVPPVVGGSELAYVKNRFTENNGEVVYLLEAIATTPSFLAP